MAHDAFDATTSIGTLTLVGADGAVPIELSDTQRQVGRAAYSLALDAQAVGAAALLVRRTSSTFRTVVSSVNRSAHSRPYGIGSRRWCD